MADPRPQSSDDLFAIDGLLDDDERAIRDTVRRFCDDRVRPHLADWFESASVPVRELARELGRLGVLGMHLEGYGCAGTSATAYGLACLELEAADSGLRSLVSVQGSLAMFAIWRYGSEEHRQRWLPAMAAGEAIGCFGLTEPDFGSNPAGMRTHAKRDGDDWVLNGTKMWITNGSQATVSVIWAKTGDIQDPKSIRGFIVPTDTRGYTGKDQKGKLSLRASDTSEIHLQDVHLPKDAILPKSGGLKSPLMCLTQARYGIAWGAIGAAMACYDEALRYAQQRVMFDRPIAQTQIQQVRLVEMLTEITKAQFMTLQLGRLKDAGTMTPDQVSLCKRNNVNMACDIAREARRLLGANGILAEYHSMRHMANLESVYTYEGTHDIHTLILGQAITGFNAFS